MQRLKAIRRRALRHEGAMSRTIHNTIADLRAEVAALHTELTRYNSSSGPRATSPPGSPART